MDSPQHLAGVLPPPHQDGPLDAADAIVQSEDAGLGRGANRDAAHVLEQDRHARLGRQRDVIDIGKRLNAADPADDHGLLAAADQRATGVAVVRLDRLRHLRDRELVLLERERIDLDVVLLDETAERHDVGDALDLREPRCDDPILDLAQLHLGVARLLRGHIDRTR